MLYNADMRLRTKREFLIDLLRRCQEPDMGPQAFAAITHLVRQTIRNMRSEDALELMQRLQAVERDKNRQRIAAGVGR